MSATDFEKFVCRVIWYALGTISLSCSLFTPYLIYKMKRWNGALLLIVSLSLTEALYDFGLILTSINNIKFAVCALQGVLVFYAGISAALWTTCFSTIILMLLSNYRFENVLRIYKYFAILSWGSFFNTICIFVILLIICIPFGPGTPLIPTFAGIATGFIAPSYLGCFVKSSEPGYNDIYNIAILCCVVYNMGIFGYVWFRIQQITGTSREDWTPAARALKEATVRMIFYPMVQARDCSNDKRGCWC